MHKRKFVIWLSVWLSALLVVTSCGAASYDGTEEVRTLHSNANPKVDSVGVGLIEAEEQFEQWQVNQYLHVLYDKHQAALRAAQRHAQEVRAASAAPAVTVGSQSLAGAFLPVEYDQACGADLPPCDPTLKHESGGNIRIWNRGCYAPVGYTGSRSPCGGSTASGKWQFVRDTWNHFMGYLNAADAPAWVQNEKARQVWAHGCGAFHWGLSPRAYGC